MKKINELNYPIIAFGFLYAAVLTNTNVAFALDLSIAQSPLTISQSASPRVMLTMSRDHQLYIKAYTDYSDLNDDGSIDTTYQDNFDYYGYFDNKKCYTYASGLFSPANAASGTNNHHCAGSSSQWSGNFLNWATMTRMDIVRKVLYGGFRSTDSTETVLERSMIPYDVHSFVKLFSTSTTAEMQNYVPYAQTSISLCNLTQGSGLAKNISTSTYPPLLRIASGSYPSWAASEVTQCQWGSGTRPSNSQNLVSANSDTGLNVRVKVCVSGLEESNCKAYGTSNKPTGLLQKYAEASKPVYFGLMTGSWNKNKSGGVLRRNLNQMFGNATSSKNEIDSGNGQFLNQGSTDEGIINALNRFRISSYDFSNHVYQNSCNSPGILSFNNGQCVEWGNPLSETYLESLRYLAGKTTPNFATDDSGFISSLPQVSWVDPMPATEWCATNSIITLSTGLNSFDGDDLSNDLGIDVSSETNAVGTAENISGNYLVGSNGTVNDKQCTAKSVANLASVSGICPEVPSLEGTYNIAGLAYYARTHDLRTDRDNKQNVTTYSVALAESLPKFEIPVGSGKVSLLPACEANSSSTATAVTSGWRICSMTDLTVESLTYTSGKLVSGSLKVNWEDSTWGNDYDMDGIAGLKFCVGSSCTPGATNNAAPSAGDTTIKVQASALQANAGHTLRFGYTITGTTNDGITLPILRPGGANFNLGDALPGSVTSPATSSYTQGTTNANLLENPLWYTAKYGGFDTIDPDQPDTPADQSWDKDNDGVPDSFFRASNPALLESALDTILNEVLIKSGSSAAVTTNSTRLDTNSVVYQAKFNSGDWTGQLLAFNITANGSVASNPTWDAGQRVTTQGINNRNIFSYNPSNTAPGIAFLWSNLNATQQALLTENQVDYLRGDQTNEQPSGSLRKRTGTNALLGDLINSDPWFISSDRNFGFDVLPSTEGSDYLTFYNSSQRQARTPMVAIGGNDGMLHVFNANVTGTGNGNEIFAYVPHTILPNLAAFTSPAYTSSGQHKYFVDGSPIATDAYFDADGDNDNDWRTVLVETFGAGGKGLFALDVTFLDPSDDTYATPETAFAASRVLWEINPASAPVSSDLSDVLTGSSSNFRYGFTNHLGNILGQASIVRMADGNFAAVFGNGYNSVNQKAVLYIVNIKTGAIIKSISTETGSTSTPNGLSTPITVDINGDRIVDAIYAGDLRGNLWKFDVSSSTPGNWDVAFKSGSTPQPLFIAKDSSNAVQPITAKPQAGLHPTSGILVYFGTGKFFETGDNTVPASPQTQTFYGIKDPCVKAAGSNTNCGTSSPNATRATLVQQSILAEGTAGDFSVRVTSKNDSNVAGDPTKKGWYMDLLTPPNVAAGERVVTQALLRNGRVIFVTMTPDNAKCSFGGTSWIMEIDALNGNRLNETPFDLTGDGLINSDDLVRLLDTNNDNVLNTSDASTSASGKKSKVGIVKTPGIVSAGSVEYKYTSGSSGSLESTTESAPLSGGRLSWHQLR
ncbi:pilus assembly protein [Methylomonas methanica]|uniref:Neisseria PilC domain protein n=1 Tax=Methylomonas methanica (strain DSM 25384 / MC09) TaxID=857087 RepID=G0A6T0_METMM|nr:PilC/PilY family type IV pilus protein [Methylomonas methanica]AEG00551.1 Neisseria PilC domain protein [Methylomonas methanica MC09]